MNFADRRKKAILDAEIGNDGKVKILFAGKFENFSVGERAYVDDFNSIAEKFSKVPTEWEYSGREKAKFAELKDEYRSALASVAEIVKKRTAGNPEFAAADYMADVDRKVGWNRFFSSNPEAEKQLEKIQSQSLWRRALQNAAGERGGYMLMGAITRGVAVNLMGVAAAPLAAAGMGGYMGRKRAIQSLHEEAKLAESGKKHSELITTVKAENLEEKIDLLFEKLSDEKDEKEKAKIIDQIDTRLNYTRYKMERGLVEYGESAEKIKRQYSLLQKISQVETYIAYKKSEGGMTPVKETNEEFFVRLNEKHAVKARLDHYLEFKERKVEKHVRNQMIKGALMGAAFSTLGYAIRDHFFGGDKVAKELMQSGEKGWDYLKAHSPLAYFFDEASKEAGPNEAVKTLADNGVPPQQLSDILKVKFPVFGMLANEDSVKIDPTGAIIKEGMPGNYLFDENTGGMVSMGGIDSTGMSHPAEFFSADAVHGVPAQTGTGISPEQLDMATVQKGEGAWQAVYRQLHEEAEKDPSKFNLNSDDLDDAEKLKSILNKETARILAENDYIKPDGSEIRISEAGSKIILGQDGKISIQGKTYEWHAPAMEHGTGTGNAEHPPIAKEEISFGKEIPEEKNDFLHPATEARPYGWRPLSTPSYEWKMAADHVITETPPDPEVVLENIHNFQADVFSKFANISDLEQEKIISVARHSIHQLAEWGIEPKTGSSFSSQLEVVLRSQKMSESIQANAKYFANLSEKIRASIDMKFWDNISHMKMSDIVRWSHERQSHFRPGVSNLFKVIKKLKPTTYEKTLDFEDFIKNRIVNGKSEKIEKLFKFK